MTQLEDLLDEDLPIAPSLLKALTATQRKVPDSNPYFAYVRTSKTVNISEAIGTLSYAMTKFNVRNDKHRPMLMDVHRWIERVGINTKFPEVCRLIAPWADDAITVAFTKGKNTRLKSSSFLKVHKAICGLFLDLPKAELMAQKVAKHEDLSKHVPTLLAGCNSSLLGAAMFGGPMTHVSVKVVDDFVNKQVAEFV